MPKPLANYPAAWRVGNNLLILSGIGPRDPVSDEVPGIDRDASGKVIGYDIRGEFNQAVDNVDLVLKNNGLALENLLSVQILCTDLDADLGKVNVEWNKLFPDPAKAPCRTCVGIAALPKGGPDPIHIELACMAEIPPTPVV